jgi:hypothetical protein
MVEYFYEQRINSVALVTALPYDLHHRLGQASKLLQLNNAVLVPIADMVLGLDKLI